MAHVAEYKKKIVKDFEKLIKEYPIIGVVNMENLPSAQLCKMRASLRESCVLRMTKRRLLKIVINNIKSQKPGIESIEKYLGGMPALLFTKENPFKLFNMLKKSKSSAPAKPGQTAPKDIVVKAGPTPFAPGPIISELSGCGVKSGVDAGKVVIKQDSIVAREGEKIKPNVAAMLQRLGIEPMEVGLNLVAVLENGVIYDRKVLDIDEEQFRKDVAKAASYALNLAVEIAFPSKDIMGIIIGKAFKDARAISMSQNILCDATAGALLAKAEMQAKAVASKVNM
jgi:large subunit ribosomal protein L10